MPEPAPTSSSDDAPEDPPESDVKRKFREALERKQADAKAGAAHEDAGAGHQHAHGAAAHKREFRRKTG